MKKKKKKVFPMQQMNSDTNYCPESQIIVLKQIFKVQRVQEIVKEKLRNLEVRSTGFNIQMIGVPEGDKRTDAEEAMIK